MSDDLIKRDDALKLLADGCYDPGIVRSISALPAVKDDRIEQLERKQSRRHTQCAGLMQAARNNVQALILAEAKLTKAMEALREIVSNKGYMDDPWGHALATLTELEGKKCE